MVTEITVDELTEFRSAVAGVEIDWVRTGEGWGPATMTSVGDDRLAVSTGGLDFSAMLHSEIPDDRCVLQLTTRAPDGLSWNGSAANDLELRIYQPSTSVLGNVPAGSRAITAVVQMTALDEVARRLDVGAPTFDAGADPLVLTDDVAELVNDLRAVAALPDLLEAPTGSDRLLESIARVVADDRPVAPGTPVRGFDSSQIVAACIGWADATGTRQPAISDLCAIAHASESRLRQAFVEMVGVPPMRFFQLRVLSMLRDELANADPGQASVTHAATSLGLTQLGRVAGRYRSVFGETPRETLRRRRPVRVH